MTPAPTHWLRLMRWGAAEIGTVLITLFGLLVLTFFIGRVIPVDPVLAIVGNDANDETYDFVYQQLGLDRPLYTQFVYYVRDVLRGDFGTAILTGRPVLEDIGRVMPATIELATLALVVGAGLGIPIGVFAATHRGQWVDHLVRVFSLSAYSMPVFWLGLLGVLIFYAKLGWAGGSGRVALFYEGMVPQVTGMLLVDALLDRNFEVFMSALRHIWLPASILGLSSMAFIGRMTRSFMLDQLTQEYVLTARVKGLSEHAVIWRHAFRNIRVQLVTILALAYGGLLEGTVLTETVFAWPGFGSYLTSSLMIGDMNAMLACVLLVGVMFIFLNILSDVLYRVFDPRTRAQ